MTLSAVYQRATAVVGRAHVEALFAHTATRIRQLSQRMGLDIDGVLALLDFEPRMSRARLEGVLQAVIAGEETCDRAGLRAVARQLEERLGVTLGGASLTESGQLVWDRVRDVAGAFITGSALYLVIGGLVAGRSRTLADFPGVVSVLIFFVLCSALAVVEALHVAVEQLRVQNLDALKSSHAVAHSVHRWIRDQHGIEAVLAGRQFITVLLVFATAQVTTMPTMRTWPLTSVALPEFVHKLLDYGVPGAIVVLGLGQLVPQFIAARRTVWFMNSRLAAAFVALSRFTDSLGISRAAHWIAALLMARAEKEPRIPTAPSLRWMQAAEDDLGRAIVYQSRRLEAGPAGVRLSINQGLTVRTARLTVASQTLALPAPPLEMSATALSGQGEAERVVGHLDVSEPATPPWFRLLRLHSHPRVGAFGGGTELRTSVVASFPGSVTFDTALVEEPTRCLVWEVEMTSPPRTLPPLAVTHYMFDSTTSKATQVGEPVAVAPRELQDGRVVATHRIDFPPPGRLIRLAWEPTW